MKKLFFSLFSGLLMTSVILTSCHDDDNGTPNNPSGGGATLTAERYGFDGGTIGKFTSTTAGFTKTTLAGITTFSIAAIRDGGQESINIVINEPLNVQTYQLDSNTGNGMVIRKEYQNVTDLTKSYSTDNNGTSMTGGGQVKITSINGNKVEGEFYGICFNSTGKEAYAEQGKFSGTIN